MWLGSSEVRRSACQQHSVSLQNPDNLKSFCIGLCRPATIHVRFTGKAIPKVTTPSVVLYEKSTLGSSLWQWLEEHQKRTGSFQHFARILT